MNGKGSKVKKLTTGSKYTLSKDEIIPKKVLCATRKTLLIFEYIRFPFLLYTIVTHLMLIITILMTEVAYSESEQLKNIHKIPCILASSSEKEISAFSLQADKVVKENGFVQKTHWFSHITK